MAETTKKTRKAHTFVSASGDGSQPKPQSGAKPAPPKGNATTLRIGAVIAWLAAIALEVVAILVFRDVIHTSETMFWVLGIGALVLDLICVVIGSTLWKKANRIDPASKANKVKFWLWNNLGVIISLIAFAPFVVLLLTDKNADGKTKTIGSVVAVVALLIAGLLSFEPDALSKEDLDAATNAYGDNQVYWTAHGSVYHSYEDCYSLDRTDELTFGGVDQAIAANRKRLCKICAKRDAEAGLDVSDVLTEEGEVTDEELGGAEFLEEPIESTEPVELKDLTDQPAA